MQCVLLFFPNMGAAVARLTKQRAGESVTVLASGTFPVGGRIDLVAMSSFVQRMGEVADIVVLLASCLCEAHESDDVWMRASQTIMVCKLCDESWFP